MSKKQSSQKITSLYARLSRDDENADVLGSIKNQRVILLNHQKDMKSKRKELEKAKKRIAEIDRIIQTLYEDNTRGKISDERFATLSIS